MVLLLGTITVLEFTPEKFFLVPRTNYMREHALGLSGINTKRPGGGGLREPFVLLSVALGPSEEAEDRVQVFLACNLLSTQPSSPKQEAEMFELCLAWN